MSTPSFSVPVDDEEGIVSANVNSSMLFNFLMGASFNHLGHSLLSPYTPGIYTMVYAGTIWLYCRFFPSTLSDCKVGNMFHSIQKELDWESSHRHFSHLNLIPALLLQFYLSVILSRLVCSRQRRDSTVYLPVNIGRASLDGSIDSFSFQFVDLRLRRSDG